MPVFLRVILIGIAVLGLGIGIAWDRSNKARNQTIERGAALDAALARAAQVREENLERKIAHYERSIDRYDREAKLAKDLADLDFELEDKLREIRSGLKTYR